MFKLMLMVSAFGSICEMAKAEATLEAGREVRTKMLPLESCWYGTSSPSGPSMRVLEALALDAKVPLEYENSTGWSGCETPNRSFKVNVARVCAWIKPIAAKKAMPQPLRTML